MLTASRPLALALMPATIAWKVALVIGASLLIALAAQVAFPLPWSPVPVTGQTFAILLVGASLGSRLRFVPGDRLLDAGLLPFIPGDLFKLTLAALLLPAARRFAR